MKKIYSLLFLVVSFMSFGQVFYSENVGTATGTLTIAANTFQNTSPIVYSGDADTRATAVSNTYSGFSAGRNVFFAAAGAKFFQIDGLNTSAYTSANILLSFGYLTSVITAQMVLEFSTNGTTWTPISFTNNTTTGWALVAIPGGVLPSSTTLSLRFTAPVSTGGMRIDDIKLTNFNPSCTLVLGNAVTSCDAVTSGIDTYTTTIPFTGGGVGPYTITTNAGTVSGNNPNSVATGDIIINGVNEGTPLSVTITKGVCTFSANAIAPDCKPVNTLPFSESFPYTVGNSLNGEQKWTAVNTGDNILIATGNLSYTGITATGNSITFTGTGAESRTLFTDTTTGTIYASFIATASDLANITTDLANTYFAVFTDATGASTNARVWIRKNGTQYQYGLGSGSAPTDWDATLYNANDVQYVVLGYDFTNTLKLFINPTVGGSAVPTIAVTPSAPYTSIGGFLFRQDTNTTTPTMIVDELRVTLTPNFTLGLQSNTIAGLNVYPNPVSNGKLYITSDSGADKTVAIYDILGKQVMATALTNDIVNVSALNAGVYIVKVTEAGNTATRKLVIR